MELNSLCAHFSPKWEVGPDGIEVHIYSLFETFEGVCVSLENIKMEV